MSKLKLSGSEKAAIPTLLAAILDHPRDFILFYFFPFIFISWRLITL